MKTNKPGGKRPGSGKSADKGGFKREGSAGKSFRAGKPGEDRPSRERKADGEEKRPFRFGDRPKKEGDKRFGDNRPKLSFGDDKPKRSFGDKPKRTFRGEEGEEKRSFRSRTGDDTKRPFHSREEGETKRPFRSREEGEEKRPFRSREEGEAKRPFRSREEGEEKRPFRSREAGETGEDRPQRKSPMEGRIPVRKPSADRRETPSGFNRKKYFDKANDRFADKQARKKDARSGLEGFEENDAATPAPHKRVRKKIEVKPAGAEAMETAGEMPLNKFVAHCGICSRRKAVDYIKEGKVAVNGTVITEPAFKVTAKDNVKLNDKRIIIQKDLVYVLLNKPKGYITTTDDPEGRQTVMELIEEAVENERVYPVGRLDRNTSGLLLLTNDGELAQRLAHPSNNIKKIYQVGLDKPLTKVDFDKIVNGVTLEDGPAQVDALGYVDPKDKTVIGIEIHSGKNRIVRRIFESLEYKVEKLDRVMYAGLTKKNLNRGSWRYLSEKEVILLKHFKQPK